MSVKQRIFYVVHLDRGRILSLSLTFSGLMLFSFALGRHFSQGKLDPSQQEQPAVLSNHSSKQEGQNFQTDDSVFQGEVSQGEESQNKEFQKKEIEDLQEAFPSMLQEKNDSLEETPTISKKLPTVLANSSQKPSFQTDKTKQKNTNTASRKKISSKKTLTTHSPSPRRDSVLRLTNQSPSSPSSPSPPSSPSSSVQHYSIQTGAFLSSERAYKMKQELDKKGYQAYIKQVGKLHHVILRKKVFLHEFRDLYDSLKKINYNAIKFQNQR